MRTDQSPLFSRDGRLRLLALCAGGLLLNFLGILLARSLVVSRRSYKEGMPFERAMDIIREGSGSHFDPQVAGAFLRAENEVRRVMNTYMGS